MLGIGEGQEIVLDEPNDMRRHRDERDGRRNVGAGRRKCFTRITVEQDEQGERDREHQHKIFRPKRHANRQTKQ